MLLAAQNTLLLLLLLFWLLLLLRGPAVGVGRHWLELSGCWGGCSMYCYRAGRLTCEWCWHCRCWCCCFCCGSCCSCQCCYWWHWCCQADGSGWRLLTMPSRCWLLWAWAVALGMFLVDDLW